MFEIVPFQNTDLKRPEDLKIAYGFVATPLGRALAGVSGGCICYLAFAPEGSDREWLADLIACLIPCHCVIRSDGQLGGYRWGSAMKRACLEYLKDSG